jgi:peptide/nickel transport system substrate-binding protein
MGAATPLPLLPVTPEATPAPRSGAGGSAIIGLVGQPPSLNPILDYDPALRQLAPLLFESLLQVDPHTAHLQPALAQSWHYSDDGRQVIFDLPPGLAWSDGTPLTASAIAESLQATRHPALQAFSQMRATDDQTLLLTFTRIDCSAVTALGLLPLLPAGQVLDPEPLGSGPFIIAARTEDQPENRRALTLVQNPNYRGPKPGLDSLVIRFIQEADAQVALSEGQFDVIGPFPSNITNPAPQNLSRLTYPAGQMIYVAINFEPENQSPLLPAGRPAFLLALDRQAILDEALAGDGLLLAGPLMPGHWANPDPEPAIPVYDPDAARAILARAGIRDTDFDGWLDRDGERLELAIRLNGANELHQKLGWLVSSYYRDLGLYAQAESAPPDSIIDDLFTHDFRLAIFSWLISPDPDQRLYWRSDENKIGQGLNFTSYRNPHLDRLLDRGVSVPGCRPESRAESYAQIQKILSEERPVDFLLAPNHHIFVARGLGGLAPGPFAPFTWNIAEWSWESQ